MFKGILVQFEFNVKLVMGALREFLEFTRRLTNRGVAYAIISLIVERGEITIIAPSEEDKELLSILLEDIKNNFDLRISPTSDIKLANFEVITLDEYYKNWKQYSGRRLIFVFEDKNLICPPLDYLERIVEETLVSRSRDPIRRLAVRISDILMPLEVAKDYYEQFKQGKINEKKLVSLIESRFPSKEDAHFALELLKAFFK